MKKSLWLAGVLAASSLFVAGCEAPVTPRPTVPVTSSSSAITEPEIVAEKLNIPWDIAFLPSGDMLVTERAGTLVRIGKDKKQYSIGGVHHVGEGGLLGIVLHPQFRTNNWIYLYMTTNQGGAVTNRVERYTFTNDQLGQPDQILTGIPGAVYHDGGRMAFGPDGYLYITAGDATREANAQDKESLAGKILRIKDYGSIPSDNPFGNAVYSYGHRNPQGITWDDDGRLWSTEHGRSGVQSGFDELNLIEKGKNYGWPVIEGDETKEGMESPVLHSGSSSTWAPASAVFVGSSIFFGGLRGEAVYQAVINGTSAQLLTHFKGTYGRIRTVMTGPDGDMYITTSNRDGRGSVDASDDLIIRIPMSAFDR